MENRYQHKIITVPNILSMLRILSIPFIVYFYFTDRRITAFIILAAACLTDMADGFIARHFHMTSDVGKVLDVIADKLMQFSVLICAAKVYPYILILAGMLALKELISGVYCLRVITLTKEISGAKIVGKISTFFLDITVLLILLLPDMPKWVLCILCILCGLSMLLSFYWYLSTFSATIKAEKAKKLEAAEATEAAAAAEAEDAAEENEAEKAPEDTANF